MDDYNNDSKAKSSYLKNPNFKNFMASAIPSVIMRPVYQPLEVLKIRFQLQHENLTHQIHFKTVEKGEAYKSIFHAVQVIHAEEGWRALFKGLGFAQVANTSASIMQFAIYRKLRKELDKTNLKDSKEWCDFFAGFITGASVAVLLNPLDCIRTHLLSRENIHTKSALKVAFKVYQDGGLAQFYNGALTALFHSGTLNGLRFMFYNIGCKYAMHYEGADSHKELKTIELIAAGFGAGCAANIFAYPFEFVKRRIMLDKARKRQDPASLTARDVCQAIFQCVRTVIRSEGPMAFYKGFGPNAMRSIISTTIQLSCYDLIYNTIDEWW